jgi:hypothetical protein
MSNGFASVFPGAAPAAPLAKEMSMKSTLLVLSAALVLAGCATTEVSYLDGRRYNRAEMHTYDVIIESVDGRSTLAYPVRVDPGRHKVVLQAPPVAGAKQGTLRTIELDVEPCKRYHLMAVRPNALSPEWEPKVDYVADLGCTGKK